jgi:hypothetical protein
MNEQHQQILESIPPDEPRSRLGPYRELILRMRRQGRTYHRIRQTLANKCGVQVAYATLYDYIKRCSRPRRAKRDTEPEVATTGLPTPAPRPAGPPRDAEIPNDIYADARERMRRLKEVPAPHKPEKRFHYTEQDSIDPLVLISQTTKEK